MKILRWIYFAAFIVGVSLVVSMHTFSRPALDVLRVPTFIRDASYFNGLQYWPTFKIYQVTLVASLLAVLTDAICLTDYRSKIMLKLSQITSVVGATLLLLSILYFSYNFLILNNYLKSTAAIFIAFSTILMALDLVTFTAEEKLLERKS